MTKPVRRTTSTFTGPDGTTLAYHRVGSGPVLVCVPGGPGRASTYLEDLAGLAEERELVLLDAPGTGDSGRPADKAGYGFRALAANVDALRDELGLERFTLLGHSAGALVAEVYAALHPERLDKLVLVTPAGWLHGATRSDVEEIKRRRSDEPWYAESCDVLAQPEDLVSERQKTLATRPFLYGAWTERQQAHAAGADREQDDDAATNYWQPEHVDLDGLRASLNAITVPTLVIGCDLDAATGVSAARGAAAGLPNAVLQVLEGSGHFPWVDAPEEFRRIVAEFLAS